MKAALAALLLVAGCRPARTEVVVVVDARDLDVPGDLDAVHLIARDLTVGKVMFDSAREPLCATTCRHLPIVLTIHPGPKQPHDLVEVEVQALRGDEVVIDDASTFTFTDGVSQRLDFILYRSCLGTRCAAESGSARSCGQDGQCAALAPQPLEGEPSLDASVRLDAAAGDFAGADLVIQDLATPDFATPDLREIELGAPALSSVTPRSRPIAGGAVTLDGAGFAAGASVTIGGLPASDVVVVSPTRITATAPAVTDCRAATVSVSVPGGGSVARDGLFAYFCATLAFTVTKKTVALGNSPTASGVAVADLDDDGDQDLAFSVNEGPPHHVYFFEGNGAGQFSAQPAVAVTLSWPQHLAAGDFTGDGKPDLLVAIYNANLLLLRNDGAFVFTPLDAQSVGEFPRYLAPGEFNGAGGLDVLVTRFNGSSVIAFDRSDAGFSSVRADGVGSAQGAAAARFDGDGRLDYAVVDHCKVHVFLNKPNGGDAFPAGLPPNSYPTDRDPVDVKAGDLDGDGKLDLVVSNAGVTNCAGAPCSCPGSGGNVSVLRGNGDGTFMDAQSYAAGTTPGALVLADFDLDGKLDVAVTLATGGSGAVVVLRGNGDGSLGAAAPFGTLANLPTPNAMAGGDFDRDGKPDLVSANSDGSGSVLLNRSQ